MYKIYDLIYKPKDVQTDKQPTNDDHSNEW